MYRMGMLNLPRITSNQMKELLRLNDTNYVPTRQTMCPRHKLCADDTNQLLTLRKPRKRLKLLKLLLTLRKRGKRLKLLRLLTLEKPRNPKLRLRPKLLRLLRKPRKQKLMMRPKQSELKKSSNGGRRVPIESSLRRTFMMF